MHAGKQEMRVEFVALHAFDPTHIYALVESLLKYVGTPKLCVCLGSVRPTGNKVKY